MRRCFPFQMGSSTDASIPQMTPSGDQASALGSVADLADSRALSSQRRRGGARAVQPFRLGATCPTEYPSSHTPADR